MSLLNKNLSKFAALIIAGAYGGGFASVSATSLSLEQAINEALLNNFSLKVVQIQTDIAEANLDGAESGFDLEIFAEGNVRKTEQPTAFAETSATSSDDRNYSAGVRKRLEFGTQITASSNLNRRFSDAGVNISNLSQSASIGLSIRQPLLQGAGKSPNRAQINLADNTLSSTREQLRESVLNTLFETESAYWQLAASASALLFRQTSVEAGETFLNQARERQRVGVATELEVLQARASLAQRTEALIRAEESLLNSWDALLFVTGKDLGVSSDPPDLDTLPVPSGEPAPLRNLWELAKTQNPDIARADLAVSRARIAASAARNDLLPQLDLVLSGSYIGLDDEQSRNAIESALDREGHSWAVGFEFSMPWGNRGAKADVRARELEITQAEWNHIQIAQTLYRQLREARRSVVAASESYAAAELTVELQTRSFEQEQDLYENGLSSLRDLLEVEQNLEEARLRLLEAKASHAIATARLEAFTNRIFQRHAIDPSILYP